MQCTVLLGDGAMGTMLQAAGLSVGEPPEKWNLSNPKVIREVHRQYIDAGADIIETNTFGGNSHKLRDASPQAAWEINLAGSRLAREMAGPNTLVAGSMGPTGGLVFPWGGISFDAALDSYAQQAQALAAGGADFILIETMTDLQEARAAAFGAMSAGIPIAIQLTFDPSGRILMGTPADVAAAVLSTLNPLWVGCNCGTGPEEMLDPIKQMRPWAGVLAAFPNAGLPEWRESEQVYPLQPEGFATGSQLLIQAGVSILGGCCGTTPSHIRVLRSIVDGCSPKNRPRDILHKLREIQFQHYVSLRAAKWVAGEQLNDSMQKSESADSSRAVASGMFLASRTLLLPLGNRQVSYQLERVGSIVEFEPGSWHHRGNSGNMCMPIHIPVIDIPRNLPLEQIAPLVGGLQIQAMPAVFTCGSLEALQATLLNYCGRAGVVIPAARADDYVDMTLAMGALPIYTQVRLEGCRYQTLKCKDQNS